MYSLYLLANSFVCACSFTHQHINRLFVRSFILSWYSVLCAFFLFLSNSFLFFSFPIVPSQISQSSIERARACSSSLTSILVFFCSSFFFYTSSFPGTFTWCVRVFHYNFQRSALMHIVCVCAILFYIPNSIPFVNWFAVAATACVMYSRLSHLSLKNLTSFPLRTYSLLLLLLSVFPSLSYFSFI